MIICKISEIMNRVPNPLDIAYFILNPIDVEDLCKDIPKENEIPSHAFMTSIKIVPDPFIPIGFVYAVEKGDLP